MVLLHDGEGSLKDIRAAAIRALLKLRLQRPEVKNFVGCIRGGQCFVRCRAPERHQEARKWAERTVVLEERDRSPFEIQTWPQHVLCNHLSRPGKCLAGLSQTNASDNLEDGNHYMVLSNVNGGPFSEI